MATDSFASGHPGMPQRCVKWEHNVINSNNYDIFNDQRQQYCIAHRFADRDPGVTCPQFQSPEGTGIVMGGSDNDFIHDNYIYDNWRQGTFLIYVPAALRGENDPAKQMDTSNGNRFTDNHMGVTPDGTSAPNGVDFWWDGAGQGNCWQGNIPAPGKQITGDPASLPGCPGAATWGPPTLTKTIVNVPCTAWDPVTNPEPPGCDWFHLPSKPRA